jgi:hypothetical protein
MTAFASDPADLVLHGPRVLGFATSGRIAARFGLDPRFTDEALLDLEAGGLVSHSAFGGSTGWSLTERGRIENERRLALELDRAGARHVVIAAHAEFVPLNRRFAKACTDWQIRPTRLDAMAFNDHTDWPWDEHVLRSLASLGRALEPLCGEVARRLERFDGYAARYGAALAKVDAGQQRWVDSPELDSCHTVWIQLHEDLLATVGIPRGHDA